MIRWGSPFDRIFDAPVELFQPIRAEARSGS